MIIKEELAKKVPKHHQQTTEYNIFLKELNSKNLKDIKAVKMYVNVEIKKCKDEFKNFTLSPTQNRYRKRCRERLEFLELIKEKVLTYV
ncbi:hypothetical protein HYV79_04265 [Candidatus Woesearchaeota archaeon]|nr:hypothetical protein [Candidatus Woesearchaeota archaeon]